MSNRKVPPNPDLPSTGSKKRDERIAVADAKSAEGYDALEEATRQAEQLAAAINSGRFDVEMELTDTGVNILRAAIGKDEKA